MMSDVCLLFDVLANRKTRNIITASLHTVHVMYCKCTRVSIHRIWLPCIKVLVFIVTFFIQVHQHWFACSQFLHDKIIENASSVWLYYCSMFGIMIWEVQIQHFKHSAPPFCPFCFFASILFFIFFFCFYHTPYSTPVLKLSKCMDTMYTSLALRVYCELKGTLVGCVCCATAS